jgi:hypothetical protein
MVILPKTKILERGKLPRINEIDLLKIRTMAKQGQNHFALDTRELLSRIFPVFSGCCGESDETRIRDLRHCWKTNTMRSGLHPLIADAIVGHGDRKKDVGSVYL